MRKYRIKHIQSDVYEPQYWWVFCWRPFYKHMSSYMDTWSERVQFSSKASARGFITIDALNDLHANQLKANIRDNYPKIIKYP